MTAKILVKSLTEETMNKVLMTLALLISLPTTFIFCGDNPTSGGTRRLNVNITRRQSPVTNSQLQTAIGALGNHTNNAPENVGDSQTIANTMTNQNEQAPVANTPAATEDQDDALSISALTNSLANPLISQSQHNQPATTPELPSATNAMGDDLDALMNDLRSTQLPAAQAAAPTETPVQPAPGSMPATLEQPSTTQEEATIVATNIANGQLALLAAARAARENRTLPTAASQAQDPRLGDRLIADQYPDIHTASVVAAFDSQQAQLDLRMAEINDLAVATPDELTNQGTPPTTGPQTNATSPEQQNTTSVNPQATETAPVVVPGTPTEPEPEVVEAHHGQVHEQEGAVIPTNTNDTQTHEGGELATPNNETHNSDNATADHAILENGDHNNGADQVNNGGQQTSNQQAPDTHNQRPEINNNHQQQNADDTEIQSLRNYAEPRPSDHLYVEILKRFKNFIWPQTEVPTLVNARIANAALVNTLANEVREVMRHEDNINQQSASYKYSLRALAYMGLPALGGLGYYVMRNGMPAATPSTFATAASALVGGLAFTQLIFPRIHAYLNRGILRQQASWMRDHGVVTQERKQGVENLFAQDSQATKDRAQTILASWNSVPSMVASWQQTIPAPRQQQATNNDAAHQAVTH